MVKRMSQFLNRGKEDSPLRLTQQLLFLLALVSFLMISAPALRVSAAWKTTSAGKMYTQSASPGYVTGLKKIGNYWYYFSKKGIMVTGWVKLDGKFSYFNSKGRRVTGWLTFSSTKKKYYFDSDGIMQTGFVKIKKNTYFFNSKGVLQTGWITYKGKRYYASSSGVLYISRWKGDYYFQSDGSLAVSTWVDGKWVNSSGKHVTTGWVTSGGSTYYYDSEGTKTTGWLTVDGNTYYLDSSTGALKKSTWFKVSKKYYYANSSGVIQKSKWLGKRYVDSDGVMVTGFYTIDSKTYYFKPETPDIGFKQTGWIKVDGKRYWLNSSGVVQTGWIKSSLYYATSDGSLATGLYYVGSDLYYFNTSTGKKITGTMVTVNSETYYFQSTGKAAVNKWIKYNKKYYYFQSTGKMAKSMWVGKYYVNEKGVRTDKVKQTGWVTSNGSKYYYDSDSNPVTGFQTIDGSTYYFDASGVMQTGLQTISDVTYYFYSNGTMAVSTTLIIGSNQYSFSSDGAATIVSTIDVTGDTVGAQIAKFAVQYVGNPYVYGGTSLTNGADCSGFVQTVFANFGIKLLRVADDQMKGPSSANIKKGYKEAVTVDLSSLLPGDLIFYGSGNYASHVGIYIGDGKIVHASNSQPYPLGGIKISDYDYSTPIKAVRYWS